MNSHPFRLSFYLSLAMSCLCLFFGEWDFLPWVCALFPVIVSLMVLAYRHEGSWQLSVAAANRLGSVIGTGTLLWVYFQVPRTEADLADSKIPWPAALLPLLAPLLPILLLVKLFRPKTMADFWVFQMISLVIVTLACILAGDVWFFVLLAVFLASLLWCMSMFFLERQKVQSNAAGDAAESPLFGHESGVPEMILGTTRIFRWTLVVLGLGLLMFFATPRFSDFQWIPNRLSTSSQKPLKVGIEAGIDLTHEGKLELSSEPAFEVIAWNSTGPQPVLPADQRWRMQTLDHYERGHWVSWIQSPYYPLGLGTKDLPHEKHFGEEFKSPEHPPIPLEGNQVYLNYKIRVISAGGLAIAEPVASVAHIGYSPSVGILNSKSSFLRLVPECDSYVAKFPARRSLLQYGQIFTPVPNAGECLALDVSQRYIAFLLSQEVPPAIEPWTRDRLLDLLDAGALQDDDVVRDESGRFAPQHHAKIARALSNHLSSSREFVYSLSLRRINHKIDPTEDFLLNVKQGHCERYATALTLMLRSLDIPARVIKGYMGAEYQQEGGRYIIRQNQAHSWVQALVPGDREGTYQWLVLDPTPSMTESTQNMLPILSQVWSFLKNPGFAWRSLVMEYNTDRQKETAKEVWNSMTLSRRQRAGLREFWEGYGSSILVLVFAGMAYFGWWLWHRLRTPTSGATPTVHFYRRLLRVLAHSCQLRPEPGQTPLEFARLASAHLQKQSLTDVLIALPVQVAEMLYRLRFAGETLVVAETKKLEQQIGELESALKPLHKQSALA